MTTEKTQSELGRLVVDLLTGFERLQYSSSFDKSDNPNSVYCIYSSTLKLIARTICPTTERNPRLFRLKYHHILSNDSVDEYLLHCLSKIVADLLDVRENNYEKFIGPVEQLHMKLMSILTKVQLEHAKYVLANRRVISQMQKRQEKTEQQQDREGDEQAASSSFVPIYFLPSCCSNKKLRKVQALSVQAVHSHYSDRGSLATDTLEMLRDFDDAFAEFELEFVCQVNRTSIYSPARAELTMEVAVMFSEAVQWARSMDLLEVRAIADCDIEIMVGVPRLAVVYGCRVARHGPLSERALNCRHEHEAEDRLAPVFLEHRAELSRLRRQLNVLNAAELGLLGRLLMDHHGDLPGPGPPLLQPPSSSPSHRHHHQHQQHPGALKPVTSLLLPAPPPPRTGDLHTLFKLVSSVADQMQSEHASDYRFFMETVFKLYKDEVDCASGSLTCSGKSRSFSSGSDLFCTQYQNVRSYFHNIIEEAVDALAYSGGDAGAPNEGEEQCEEDFSFQWNFKTFQSARLRASAAAAAEQPVGEEECCPRSACGCCARSLIRDRHSGDSCGGGQGDALAQCSRPEWREDTCFPRCCHCNKTFNVFRRRHHCRRCGYLFCGACWGTKLALPSLGIHNKVSICVECEEFLLGGRGSPSAVTTPATPTRQESA